MNEQPEGENDWKKLLSQKGNKTLVYLFGATIAAFVLLWLISREKSENISYQDFLNDLLKIGLVSKIEIVNQKIVRIYLKGNENYAKYHFVIPDVNNFEIRLDEALLENNIESPIIKYTREIDLFEISIYLALPLSFVATIIFFARKANSQMKDGPFSFGKSVAKKFNKDVKIKTSFKDVAGCDEAKLEIQEFVSFLKNPKKYEALGAKIPKGALLIGPPGTGKTLLAKATAGEAGVTFYSIAGSDFNELYVGVGSARVRSLFKEARKNSPCIVFIDEIDAVGAKRSSFGNNVEQDNTLNQLLVEMDGFTTSKNPVVVLAGTNRHEILDPALLRPGRFDRTIALELPDIKARQEILMVHLPKLKLEKQASYYAGRLASMTPGFSGADLSNLCNEAALIAARFQSDHIQYNHFEQAFERVVGGLENKSLLLSKVEKNTVAFHEAGHVTVSWFLKYGSPLLKVSILPRSKSLGYAMYIPEEHHIYKKDTLTHNIAVSLGGRAAEELTFGVITTGAQDDLQKVTELVYGQILSYGMCENFGLATFGSIDNQGYIGKNFSESTSISIDNEARVLVKQAYELAKDIIRKNNENFTKLAQTLLQKEVLSYDDCCTILGERPWPPSPTHQKFMEMRETLDETQTNTKNSSETQTNAENSSENPSETQTKAQIP